jgi:hypothetical protein
MKQSNWKCEICGRTTYVSPIRQGLYSACKGSCRSILMRQYPKYFKGFYKKGGKPWNTGKVWSSKIRQKIGATLKGKNYSTVEGRQRISEALKGNLYWKLVKNRLKGKDAPNWQGGKRSWKKIIYDSSEYKNWRRTIFERDNYTCQECGTKNGNGKGIYLQAHHIKPFAYYPKLRFDLNNGKTLCVECHKKTETFGWKGFHARYRHIKIGERSKASTIR